MGPLEWGPPQITKPDRVKDTQLNLDKHQAYDLGVNTIPQSAWVL